MSCSCIIGDALNDLVELAKDRMETAEAIDAAMKTDPPAPWLVIAEHHIHILQVSLRSIALCQSIDRQDLLASEMKGLPVALNGVARSLRRITAE